MLLDYASASLLWYLVRTPKILTFNRCLKFQLLGLMKCACCNLVFASFSKIFLPVNPLVTIAMFILRATMWKLTNKYYHIFKRFCSFSHTQRVFKAWNSLFGVLELIYTWKLRWLWFLHRSMKYRHTS